MFDKLKIRTKLVAIVAGPLAALVVLAAIGGLQRRSEASDASRDATRIEVVDRAAGVAHGIQVEAVLTTAALAGKDPITPVQLGAQRKATDDAIYNFRRAVADLNDTELVTTGVIRGVTGQLDFISTLRTQVDRKQTSWDEIARQYEAIDDAFLQLPGAFQGQITDPTLDAAVQNLAALAALKSAITRQGISLTGVLSQGSFSDQTRNGQTISGQDLKAQFDQADTDAQTQLAVFDAGATAEGRTELRNKLSGASVNLLDTVAGRARDAAAAEKLNVDPIRYRKALADELDILRGVEASTGKSLLDSAAGQASTADRASRLFLAGALLATLLSLLLAALVAASITRPLGRLTVAVDHVAKEQLPRLVESLKNPSHDATFAESVEAIDVGGGAELHHLGEAVSSIQRVAVEVATEQASLLRKGIGDMFVNLARRNQALLDRQIEFIDELEATEQDPDHLERLYRLDHMATRMRRNAESLLVLAGAEPTRRRGRPVPLADVVRAALGEVEDYARIDLLSLDEVMIKSTAALDVAHMLSELMENATHFSPPDTRVEIVGHRTKADGYVVSVSDHGIGMTADQLGDANVLLAKPPLVGLAMSRSLGFIVVGRLAARFGISVRLMPSPTGGVTAVAALPADLVAEDLPSVDDLVQPRRTVEDEGPLASVHEMPTPNEQSAPEPESSYGSNVFDRPFDDASFETAFDTPAYQPVPEEEPATLDDALPVGDAFDEGLSTLVEEPVPVEEQSTRMPKRRAIDPATVAFGMPERMPTTADDFLAPTGPVAREVGPVNAGLPTRAPTSRTGPRVVADHAMGSALDAPGGRPGLFGGGAPASPVLPEPLPASTPEAEPRSTNSDDERVAETGNGDGDAGMRLFGAGPTVPLTPRPAAPVVSTPVPGANRTTSGLVRRQARGDGGERRVPGSDGDARKLPGGEGARNVTTTQRSPDEVRAMLSRFRSGQQQASGSTGATPRTNDPAAERGPASEG